MSAATTTGAREPSVFAEARQTDGSTPERVVERKRGSATTPLLGVIAAILVIGALKLAAPVVLPLALAVLLLALVWPLQKRLADHLPLGSSTLVAMAVLFSFLALFGVAVFAATNMIASRLPVYGSTVQERYSDAIRWAEERNFPYEPNREDVQEAARRALTVFGHGVQGVYSLFGRLVLTLLFLLFGLLEIPSFYRKLQASPEGSPGAKLLEASNTIARRYRQYMWTKAFTSALTGVVTGLFCWALGVDLAFVWGFLAFLLNFIPNIGSIIAVIPPTVLAFIQFGELWHGLAVLGGLAIIQITIGSYIDPRLQGRNLKLSPFVVILSIVFWGWLWGVVGALVGVPMTVGVVAVCRHFDRTAWIATMLADVPHERRAPIGNESDRVASRA